MLRRVAVSSLAAVAVLATAQTFAASIVPPENLGELALRSRAVVLARGGESTPFWRGQLLMTRTTFTVIEVVAGEAGSTSTLAVETPGGEKDGIGWAVAGSPKFKPGQVYLLFLDRKGSGEWRPAMLSYGLLERVIGRDGSHLLTPVQEQREMLPFPRSDGVLPEAVGTYREIALLPHLGRVARGVEAWNGRLVEADSRQIPLMAGAMAPPAGCAFMGSGPTYPRWPYNTGSPPGQVQIFAENDGDSSLAGGGFTEVARAIGPNSGPTPGGWMNISNTSLNFTYGGPMNFSMTCTGDDNDNPGFGNNIVVFNDPCSDIGDLNPPCNGTLGFGGPWYGGTHSFDGATWYSIGSLFVVVNNGAGCLGSTNYQLMLTHELGHGVGFGHVSDSGALMYFMCCNTINATDTTCAQYTYPGGSSTPTPTPPPGSTPTPTPTTPPGATPTATPSVPAAPTGVTASDGTFPDRVQISWNAVSGASFYRVYRNVTSSTSGATQLGIAYATQFNDSTAAVGTTYWYWVQAENTNGLSPLSASDTGFRGTGTTPTPTVPPPTPTPPGPTSTPTPTTPPVPTSTPTPQVPPTPTPVPPSNVAVVAHNTGAQGTAWRSDVTLANPSDAALPVDLRYKASGGAVTSRSLSLAARETRLLGDVLVSFFGLGDGRGALQVVPPTAGPAPAVASRTYNQTAAGNLGFGTMSVVPPAAGTYYIPGLYADTVARTNLAVTAGSTGTNATVVLHRGVDGAVGSAVNLWVGANDQQQWAVQDLFPGTAQTGVPMSVSVQLDGAAQAYATQVDQASGDTVFLAGSPAATTWLIPVVAHNSGAGGTYWRSDLYLFNPSGMLSAVTLDYLPEGRDNSSGGTASTSVTLGPFATVTIPDLVGTRFGVTQGKGSLAITSSMPVIAASRCYTTRALGGTLGFGAPALRPTALHLATRTLPGVRVLDGYRTNLGLFTGASGANVTLRLRNANGALLATNSTLWVPPRTLLQLSLGDAFPGAPSPSPVGAVEVQTNAPLGAYLSVVDGSSQDPILVLAP